MRIEYLFLKTIKQQKNSQDIIIYDIKTDSSYTIKNKLYSASNKNVMGVAGKIFFIGGRKNLTPVNNITEISINREGSKDIL